MRLTAILWCLSLPLLAQEPAIHGVVLEFGTSLPVNAAEVTISEYVTVGEDKELRQLATLLTNERGEYSYKAGHPGSFLIEIMKAGYSRSGYIGPDGATVDVADVRVTLTREKPVAAVRTELLLPGELSGRVVDEDRRPVEGLDLEVDGPQLTAHRLLLTTDRDGVFRTRVIPGKYIVQVSPSRAGKTNIVSFAEQALDVIDQDIEPSYWPGGMTERSSVLPITVGAGARIDTGTITIRKVPYYRAHLKIDCGGVAELRIFLREQPESTHPCKPDLLLRGLRPGSTRLGVESTDSAKWGTVELTISDKNISVPVVLAPAVEVRGRVITADGAAAPSGSVRLVISNTERPTSNVTQSEEGEFVHKASWGAQSVEARVLTADAYLSEIRYGGRRLTERTFDPVPGAELEVVLGRPAASLAATATRDGQVAPANVLAVRWPIDPKAPLGTQITAISSPSGLAPGEYRVVAIPFNARWEGEAEFRRLLESGQTVRLEPGEKRTLMLELPR